MPNYSGAIDYLVYKHNGKYICLFLDNHNPESYCKENFQTNNIDNLFEDYINKKSLYILEEPVGLDESELNSIYSATQHLNKYLKFYKKYRHDSSKIVPIDIRMVIDKFYKKNGFDLTDELFGYKVCTNEIMKKVLQIFNDALKISKIFEEQLEALKKRYNEFKTDVKKNTIPNNCSESSEMEEIYLNYPFEIIDSQLPICEFSEQLLAGIMEIYAIAHILLAQQKYIFIYLGASHCLTIGYLLEKYYGFRNIRNLDKYLISNNRLHLSLLDNSKKSCINFKLDENNNLN